jgi:hypothetical protein
MVDKLKRKIISRARKESSLKPCYVTGITISASYSSLMHNYEEQPVYFTDLSPHFCVNCMQEKEGTRRNKEFLYGRYALAGRFYSKGSK